MPKFRFKNESSGTEFTIEMPQAVADERIRPDGRLKKTPECVLIGRETVSPLKFHSTWDRGHRSDAMGINPEQRIEALEADKANGLTGVDYDPATGEAIFSCPTAFKAYCEHHGFYDRNGGHGSPQRFDNREREIRGLPALPEQQDRVGNAPVFLNDFV